MEAGRTPPAGLGAELDRIEASVGRGETDLRQLGFWRVVGLIKRDPELVERYADQVGRIDAKAFRARVRFQIPVWVGNAILIGVVVVGIVAVATAIDISSHGPNPVAAGIGLIVAAGAWAVGLHSPTHYVVGRLVGIRFLSYFLGGPPPPRPGLKTDYATYLRADPMSRAWMHASGAIATKLAPFLALAFAPAARAAGWAAAIIVALGVLQIVTDVLFSTKTSDWKKVRREREIARSVRRSRP